MEIQEFDFDLDTGFAWMTVSSPKEGETLIVQCCLESDKRISPDNDMIYLKRIIAADCGHDWGSCIEANKPAFKQWGENRCMTQLFQCAEQNGIKVTY